MMSPEEKKELQQKIDETIVATRKEITRLRVLSQPVSPDNAIGRITRMDAIQSKSMSEASLRKMETKLLKLEDALIKIDEPNFGSCVRCGNQIQAGRLMFMPESTHCINCASR